MLEISQIFTIGIIVAGILCLIAVIIAFCAILKLIKNTVKGYKKDIYKYMSLYKKENDK